MSNEIQVANTDYEMMWKISQRVSATPFVPTALRGKNEAVLACILYGAELGLGPMQSLNSIHVIEGRTAMSPELMRAMVARHGHRIDVLENTNSACEVKGIRADTGSTATVRWTIEDAKMAGLAGKNNWKTYPRAMLLARATSELCRIVFPDVIAGLSYTPEEVASIEGVDFDMGDVAAEEVIIEMVVDEPEIVDAEIIEEEKPTRKKVGSFAETVEKELDNIKSMPAKNGMTFEERLAMCESWGRWPYVKAVCAVASKKMGTDMPISFYELAHNESLFNEVRKAIEAKM